MTKNADTSKYKYEGHGICFESTGKFTHQEGNMARNVVIFGVDMADSKHADNKTKNVLVLGGRLIQKIDNATIYAERAFSLNFSIENETFCLSLPYNGDDSYLFVNGKEVLKFKAKAQSVITQLSLGNISADFNQTDRKSTELYGYVYDLIIDYLANSNDKILDIHDYLMKKKQYHIKCSASLKRHLQ